MKRAAETEKSNNNNKTKLNHSDDLHFLPSMLPLISQLQPDVSILHCFCAATDKAASNPDDKMK